MARSDQPPSASKSRHKSDPSSSSSPESKARTSHRGAPAADDGGVHGDLHSEDLVATESLRLNVYLQRRGVASRRKADELISAGLVRVNRKVVTALGSKVTPGDSVSVNGRVLRTEVPVVTYLLNKPDLTLTTRKDGRSRTTIFDLPSLAKIPHNVQPVGRLDFRSEGLLILTNDGDLALALSHPKYHVDKTYAVLVSEQFTPNDLERLRNGVELADGFAKPLAVKLGGTENLGGSRGQWLKVVVAEGRHRLVRRMLAAIGFKVVRLVRIGVGGIQLPDNLATGQIAHPNEVVKGLLEQYKQRVLESPLRAEPPTPKTTVEADDFKPRKKKNSRFESLLSKARAARKKQNDTKPYSMRKQSESMELAKQKRKRKQAAGNSPSGTR